MSSDKKSFILYADQYEVLKDLKTQQKGWLFSLIFAYVRGEPLPEEADSETLMAFKFIRMQLDRDMKKYEKFVEKQKENGSKGGRPKGTQKTQAFSGKPKKAYTVTDTDTDTDITPLPPKGIRVLDLGIKDFSISHHLDDDDWQEVRQLLDGLDVPFAVQEYNKSIRKKGLPENPCAAFKGWCRGYKENHPT